MRQTGPGRYALFVAMVLMAGACVQIVGIDEPHPKVDNAEPVDLEWANWPMPNPQKTMLPNEAIYTTDMTNALVTDEVTHLMWQRTVDSGLVPWGEANQYCQDLTQGGYDDWRVPTAIELISLLDFSKAAAPAIDTTTFLNTPSDWFWSATPHASLAATRWTVTFNEGKTGANDESMPYYVRCVR